MGHHISPQAPPLPRSNPILLLYPEGINAKLVSIARCLHCIFLKTTCVCILRKHADLLLKLRVTRTVLRACFCCRLDSIDTALSKCIHVAVYSPTHSILLHECTSMYLHSILSMASRFTSFVLITKNSAINILVPDSCGTNH